MRSTVKRVGVLLAALMMITSCGGNDHPAEPVKTSATPGLSQSEATDIGTEAYAYAYPLVTMEYTRREFTNVPAGEDTKAPMGQFARMRTYPNAAFHAATAPNTDTLYTQAWFDVSKEPWIVTVPDMGDRYFLLPMMDAWTNVFASPGTRNGGGKARTFAITGPGWHGSLPPNVLEYKSPTALVWLLGRIYCSGTPEDYDAVHKLQDQITATPLSSFGKQYLPLLPPLTASVDMVTSVRQQVNALGAPEYFKLFARLLKTNPPAAADAPMVAKLARIGIVPGQDFDPAKLPAAANTGLAMAPKLGQDNISGWREDGVVAGDFVSKNGWAYTIKAGTYGTNYRQRAFVTEVGVGANLPEDAVYPTSDGPDLKQKYSGATKYIMHFDKGQLPPAQGILVADHVQRRLLLRRQPAEPLQPQPARQAGAQPRRLDRHLHSGRIAWPGQGIQLAAGAEGTVQPDAAAVLAQRQEAVDPGRDLAHPAGQSRSPKPFAAKTNSLPGTMSLTSGAALRPKSAISSAAGVTVTFQPWRPNHSPTGSRSSKYHSSSVRGMSRSGSTLAINSRTRSIRSRRLARISSSRNFGPNASTATRLPGRPAR